MIRFILGLLGAVAVFYRLALRMARYGMPELKVEVDNSGGTPVDMSTYVRTVNGVDIQKVVNEITSAGDTAERWDSINLTSAPEIVLAGPYDDTATTGPDAIFNSVGDTRTVKFTFGGSKTFEVEGIIRRYGVRMGGTDHDTYEVAFQPTGAITQA